MNPIKIIIKGNPVVKKNTSGTSFYYKDKNGIRRLRTKKDGTVIPLHFYTQVYQDWAKGAMISCYNFRTEHPEIKFPLEDKMNLKCLFFVSDPRRIRDLSNLYEGTQDVLAGKSGVELKSLPSSAYQIIADDNIRFIGSHDGSRVLPDYINPRTELILSDFIMFP